MARSQNPRPTSTSALAVSKALSSNDAGNPLLFAQYPADDLSNGPKARLDSGSTPLTPATTNLWLARHQEENQAWRQHNGLL